VDLVYLIPVAAIVGAFWMVIVSITTSARLKEMKYRERIAMIEKGLAPPPEIDPVGFERVSATRYRAAARRFQSGGVMLIGIGVAVAIIIWTTADRPRIAAGIGGAFAVLGLVLIVNSWLVPHEQPRPAGGELTGRDDMVPPAGAARTEPPSP
jgi:hypothetical protein